MRLNLRHTNEASRKRELLKLSNLIRVIVRDAHPLNKLSRKAIRLLHEAFKTHEVRLLG